MSVSVRVVAPYVTLKVKALQGQDVVQGYYEGAVVDAVDNDNLQKHLRTGMVEAVPGTQVDEPEPDEEFVKPHGNAGRDAWVTYALESGQASEDEVADLTRDELREKYGN